MSTMRDQARYHGIEHSRYNLILQATNEQDRNFGDRRKHFFARPYLMAESGNISGGRNDTVETVKDLRPI